MNKLNDGEFIGQHLVYAGKELSLGVMEFQTKVSDLSRVNNDMTNLIAGSGVGGAFRQ